MPGTEQRCSTKAGAGWLSHQAHRPQPGSWLQAPSCCPANPTTKREMGKRHQPTGTDRAERTGTHLLCGSMAGPSAPRLSSSPETETTCPRLPAHPSSAGAGRRRVGRGGSEHRHSPRRRPHRGPGTRGDPDGTPETAPLRPRGPEGTPEVTPPRPRAGLRGEGEPSRSDSSPHADAGGFSPPSPGRSRGYGLPAPPAGRVPRAGTRGRGHGAGIQPRAGALRRGSRSSPAPQLQKPRAAQGPSAQHPTRSR